MTNSTLVTPPLFPAGFNAYDNFVKQADWLCFSVPKFLEQLLGCSVFGFCYRLDSIIQECLLIFFCLFSALVKTRTGRFESELGLLHSVVQWYVVPL
jgi:hypothetical protein